MSRRPSLRVLTAAVASLCVIALIAVAARVGPTRLIDNIEVAP